jgi:acyl-CoA synthetase (AMP-forming)/AMP-acid ligase II
MRAHVLSNLERETLYSDEQLGAGNFLFKAYAVCSDRDTPFIQLENAFTTPYGDVFAQFGMRELLQTVQDLAGWYRANGVKSGAYVCTYTEEGVSPFVHFLALNSIGATPVPINCQMSPQIAAMYAERNGFDAFVYDSVTNERTGVSGLLPPTIRGLNASLDGGTPRQGPLADWPVQKFDGDTIVICHSSGTTGVPKAVVFTHEQFFHGKRHRLRDFVESSDERMLSAFPQAHSAGISYLMTTTMLGLPTIVLSELTGESVAAQIEAFKPTIVLGFPRTYVSLLELERKPGAFSSVLRYYNTGDSAHEAHIRGLIALSPRARLYDGFGASELGMSCFWKISTATSITSRRCVGKVAPHAAVKVVDASGATLPPTEIGYLAVKSKTLTPGYFGMPYLTDLCLSEEGYWQTGDVGYLDEEGNFFHLDRAVDIVGAIRGPVYSLALEEALQQVAGVLDAHVIGANRISSREQTLVALIASSPGSDVDLHAALERILDHEPQLRGPLPSFAVGVCLLSRDCAVPLGSTGKVLKRTLRDTFWEHYRGFHFADRSVFSRVLWNSQGSARRHDGAVAMGHMHP